MMHRRLDMNTADIEAAPHNYHYQYSSGYGLREVRASPVSLSVIRLSVILCWLRYKRIFS